MTKAKNLTSPTDASVANFLSSIEDSQKRYDGAALADLMHEVTGLPPIMWGPSIVGFGNHHYAYASGREGNDPAISFAVRKNALTLYGVLFYEHNQENIALTQKLGIYSHGKGCLYIKSLKDVDRSVLKQMLQNAFNARNDGRSD